MSGRLPSTAWRSRGWAMRIAGRAQTRQQSPSEKLLGEAATLTASAPPTILALFGRNDSMRKPIRKKAPAKTTPPRRPAKHAGAKHPRSQQDKASVTLDSNGKLTFNHAMVYVKDVERGLAFYRDLLGFKLIEDFRYENKPVYARLCAPGGDGTIALHQAGPEVSVLSDGVRLYFEVRELDDFCRNLQQKGFTSPSCHA